MAELPELWTEKTPERLSDRTPAFGVSHELARLQEEAMQDDIPPAPSTRRRERGPFVTYLCLPWSYGDGDRQPGETWHRMKCRLRRHQMTGGHMVQVGGEVVFLERTCRWCGAFAEGDADARTG